jgi:serine/threonine-protein kinase
VPGLFLLTLNATTGTRTASSSYQSPKPDPTPAATGTTSSPKPTPSPAPIPDPDHAGRTDDDSAAIAMTLRDGRAIAYFCDGRAKEARLKGEVGDDGTLRHAAAHREERRPAGRHAQGGQADPPHG